MTSINSSTGALAASSTTAAKPAAPANLVAPPAPPPPTPNTAAPTPDRSAVGSGTGTSKLKLEGSKPKPEIKTDGDDRWQTEQTLKDLHLNQRDLFGNLMEKVGNSDKPEAKAFEKELIGMQKDFDKSESAGNYKECRQIHKEMQKLSHEILETL